MIVDEVGRRAVVRASYCMMAKGADEVVVNDLVWFLDMDEEGGRVVRSIEFIDGAAAGALREKMKKGGGA